MKAGPDVSFGKRAFLSALLLFLPLLIAVAPSPALAQSGDSVGAIYFDEDERVFGASSDHTNRDEAERVAKRTCESSGGRKCIFAVVFEANQCGALADGDDDWSADYGSSNASARSNALSDCRKHSGGCKVIVAACNQPGSSTAPAPAPQVRRAAREGNLAYDLQEELKYIGCYSGSLDGVWGRGSQAALRRFCDSGGPCLGAQPTQKALEAARNEKKGFCKPVKKRKGCGSGSVFLEGQCIRWSEVAEFCGPGFERSGSRCVEMRADRAPSSVKKKRCSAIKFAFTRGNTCACSGGRIFTGSACVKPQQSGGGSSSQSLPSCPNAVNAICENVAHKKCNHHKSDAKYDACSNAVTPSCERQNGCRN